MHRVFLSGLIFLLAACSGGPPGGTLAVAVVGEGRLADDVAAEASRATLIRRAAGGELVAGLATSWRFLDNGNSLILRLAPVRWPERLAGAGNRPGAELLARDVVAGLRRSGPEARAAAAAAGLAARNTARAPITRVVELSPRPATPLLLDWLAQPALAVRDRRGRLFPGPYGLARDGSGWQLDRRGDGPRPDARAAAITIQPMEAAAAIAAFDRGQLQLVLGEGLAGLGAARSAGQGRALKLEAVHGVIGLAINARANARANADANAQSGPLSDARLRRALLLAADATPMANRLALALMAPQNRLWDGLPPPQDDRARRPEERRALATALLAQAGFGPAQPLRLRLLVPGGPDSRALAEALVASLQPVGFAVAVQAARSGGFAVARRSGRHDLALVELMAPVPDVVAHLGQWRCGRALPCSADADRWLDKAAAAGNDLAAREAATGAAETALMADPAFIPLLRPVRWALVANDLTGFQPNALGRHPLGRIAAGAP